VVVSGPFFGSDKLLQFERRGGERHLQFFRFLRAKGHLDAWLSRFPSFLPLTEVR
jgi:hypothetical protein